MGFFDDEDDYVPVDIAREYGIYPDEESRPDVDEEDDDDDDDSVDIDQLFEMMYPDEESRPGDDEDW